MFHAGLLQYLPFKCTDVSKFYQFCLVFIGSLCTIEIPLLAYKSLNSLTLSPLWPVSAICSPQSLRTTDHFNLVEPTPTLGVWLSQSWLPNTGTSLGVRRASFLPVFNSLLKSLFSYYTYVYVCRHMYVCKYIFDCTALWVNSVLIVLHE